MFRGDFIGVVASFVAFDSKVNRPIVSLGSAFDTVLSETSTCGVLRCGVIMVMGRFYGFGHGPALLDLPFSDSDLPFSDSDLAVSDSDVTQIRLFLTLFRRLRLTAASFF